MRTELVTLDPAVLDAPDPKGRRLFRRDPASGKRLSDPVLEAIEAGMRYAFETGEKFLAVKDALASDMSRAPALRALELQKVGAELGNRAAAKFESVTAQAAREIAALTTQTSTPPPPTNALDAQLEGELRGAIRSMKPAERTAMLNDLDDKIAAAVLRGHAVLSGVTPAEQELYRERWRRAKHPEAVDKIARWSKAVEHYKRGDETLAKLIKAAVESPVAQAATKSAKRTDEAIAAATAAQ